MTQQKPGQSETGDNRDAKSVRAESGRAKWRHKSSYYRHSRYNSIRNKLPERRNNSVIIKSYRLSVCEEIFETIQPPSLLVNIKDHNDDDEDHDAKDVDSGYAWVILAVMFLINASTFGTARAYGLIFEKLAREDDHSRTQAALPFTIMGAIENMGGPLTGYLLARYCTWRMTVVMGSGLITLSHLLAAYLDSLAGQILTMGLMCGIGLSFVTISSFQINNAYFVRYRSRAFGFCLTGAAFGALYISPLCEYVLDNSSTKDCYLLLSLILFPNVPLSMLLKPKRSALERKESDMSSNISTVSKSQLSTQADFEVGLWYSIKEVISNPIFHLIWPTQLLFCWFNFVYGMIIVDFGKDRGLTTTELSQMIPVWAVGQLVGRLGLGSLVDLGIFSHKSFTIICFAVISVATWSLDNMQFDEYQNLIILVLVFILSTFISNLYILFNGLVVNYMEESQVTLGIGISSFIGSFFLLPRAYIIGYYRDTTGNYDTMLTLFSYVSLLAAAVWIVMPSLLSMFKRKKRNLVSILGQTNIRPDICKTNISVVPMH